MSAPPQPSSNAEPTDGTRRYLAGWQGAIIVVEAVFCLIAFFCVVTSEQCSSPAQGFYGFITLLGCIATFIPVSMRLLGYDHVLDLFTWLKLECISLVAFLFVFLFCLIFASIDACTDAWIAGVVFGWFAFVAFIGDAAITIRALQEYRRIHPEPVTPATPASAHHNQTNPPPYPGLVPEPSVPDPIALPDNWVPMRAAQVFYPIEVHANDPEHKAVVSNFAQPQVRIVKIERIQNPALYRQYMLHKQEMDRRNPREIQNERRLWHGTAGMNAVNINASNFNRAYAGQHAVVYGNGVYFAVKATYSVRNGYCPPDDQGLQYIYQARVLTGMYAQGAQGMREPPPMPGIFGKYDSVVDNMASPNIFVTFHDAQCYPEYLVTFKS